MRLLALSLIVIGLIGCNEKTAGPPFNSMTKSEVEAHLADEKGWKNVALKETEKGVYEGTATLPDGSSSNVKVTTTETEFALTWTSGNLSGEDVSRVE